MTTLDDLIGALRGAPRLPRAACRGLWVLFDDVDDPDDALALCALCPEQTACQQWADTQPDKKLHGVIAGRVYTSASQTSQQRKAATA